MIADEHIFHVVPYEDGWAVKRESAERVQSYLETKELAVKRGRRLATAREGRLVIHRKDGTVQKQYTYAPMAS